MKDNQSKAAAQVKSLHAKVIARLAILDGHVQSLQKLKQELESGSIDSDHIDDVLGYLDSAYFVQAKELGENAADIELLREQLTREYNALLAP